MHEDAHDATGDERADREQMPRTRSTSMSSCSAVSMPRPPPRERSTSFHSNAAPLRRTLTALGEMLSDSQSHLSIASTSTTPPAARPLPRQASTTTVRHVAHPEADAKPSVMDIFGIEAFSGMPAYSGHLLEPTHTACDKIDSSGSDAAQAHKAPEQGLKQAPAFWHSNAELDLPGVTHVEEEGHEDNDSEDDESSDVYDMNTLEAGKQQQQQQQQHGLSAATAGVDSTSNGHSSNGYSSTNAPAAAAGGSSANGHYLNALPPKLQRLGSSHRSTRSDVSRADSEQAAELREAGDVFPNGDLPLGSDAPPIELMRMWEPLKRDAAAPGQPPLQLQHQHQKQYSSGTIGRGQGGDLAAAVAAARRGSGSGAVPAAATAGHDEDPQWKLRASRDMQALGRRLGHKHHVSHSRGEWGGGLNDPWKKYGKSTLFLLLLGALHGCAAYGADLAIIEMQRLRQKFGDGRSYAVEFALYALYMVAGTAVAAYITARCAPEMAGSGIPVMKWLMGTDDIRAKAERRFTVKAYAVKAVCLILAAGVGLNIGREGPFVHMAGMLAFLVMKHAPYFEDLLRNGSMLRQMFVASTSLGVSSVFGATIGGVLLAVEITSTYYLVAQYFKGFVAAISGAVAVQILRWINKGQHIAKLRAVPTNITQDDYDYFEITVFIAMGVLCGFLGPMYSRTRLAFLAKCRQLGHWQHRNLEASTSEHKQFMLRTVAVAVCVALMTAVMSFFAGPFNRLGPFEAFADLLADELPERWRDSATGGVWGALVLSFVTRWIMAAAGTSICVPAGDFIQTAVLGAALGRLAGETLKLRFEAVEPAVYALIGSAAFSGGATQSISAAVVLMEFTGGFTVALPALLTVIIAFGVSRGQGLNIYDSVMKLNGLRALQGLVFNAETAQNTLASDIMNSQPRVVPAHPTVEDILKLLEDKSIHIKDFPVVSDMADRIYLGTVARHHLAGLVRSASRRKEAYADHISSRIPKDLSALGDEHSNAGITRTLASLYGNLKTIGRGSAASSMSPGKFTISKSEYSDIESDSEHAARGSPSMTGDTSKHRVHWRGSMRTRQQRRQQQQQHSAADAAADDQQLEDLRESAGQSGRLNLSVLQQSAWDETKLADALRDEFLNQKFDLIAEDQRGRIFIDPSQWTVPESMPMGHLHVLFELLRATRLFVVVGGQLKGVITRDTLYDALTATQPSTAGYSGRSM